MDFKPSQKFTPTKFTSGSCAWQTMTIHKYKSAKYYYIELKIHEKFHPAKINLKAYNESG